MPNIIIEGGTESDPLTVIDIADWMNANGWSNNVQTIDVLTGLEVPVVVYLTATIKNVNEVYFKIPSRTHFIQEYGKIFFTEDSTFQIGDRLTGNNCINGAMWHCMTGGSTYSGTYGNFLMYDSVMWPLASDFRLTYNIYRYYSGSMFHMYCKEGKVCEIIGSIYEPSEVGIPGRMNAFDAELKNSFLSISGAEFGIPLARADNITYPQNLTTKYTMQSLKSLNFKKLSDSVYDIAHFSGGRADTESCSYHINLSSPNDPDGFYVRYYMTSICGAYYIARMCNMDIQVVDASGDPIQGASLEVYDKNDVCRSFRLLDTMNKTTMDTFETELVVADSVESELLVGDTVRINSEDMLITGKVLETLEVERGYNDTTPGYYRGVPRYNEGLLVLKKLSTPSDADGLFRQIQVMFAAIVIPATGVTTGWILRKWVAGDSVSPHRIVITALGYEKYENVIEITGLTEPINEVITLERSPMLGQGRIS